MKDANYYVSNPEEFDLLSDDQKEAVVNGEVLNDEGDTVSAAADTESSIAPDAGTEANKEPTLLAKDGVHTIPYSALVEERQRVAQLEALIANQGQLIEKLRQAEIVDEGTGKTEAQESVMDEYVGDFPEIAEDLKPLIRKMIDDGIKQGVSEFQQQFSTLVAPAMSLAQDAALEKHFAAIGAVHPDYEEITKDVSEWISGRPAFIQPHLTEVFEKGTAAQINELLTEFKAATGRVGGTPVSGLDAAGKAKQIIADTKPKAPATLSDIPASTSVLQDETAAMMNMTPRELEAKFANKSPDEIMKMLNRLV